MGLLGTLASFFVALFSSFSDPMQQSDTPDHPKDNTNETTDVRINPGSGAIRVVIDSIPPPIPPSNEKKTEHNRKKRRKTIKFYAELLVGFFVILYTIVSICLWRSAQHANEISNTSVENADRNFRIDERAWVGFGIGGTVTFNLNQSFLIPTRTSNTGKTPAKNVHGNVVVGVFKKGEPLNFDYNAGHGNANWGIESGTIFPNGSVDESFQGLHTGANGKAEAILLKKPLYEAIRTGQSFIIVHGEITYNDIFGTVHWTTFCRYATNPSLISKQCIEHNETDNN